MTHLCDIISAPLKQRWGTENMKACSIWNDIAFRVRTSYTPRSQCHRCVIFFPKACSGFLLPGGFIFFFLRGVKVKWRPTLNIPMTCFSPDLFDLCKDLMLARVLTTPSSEYAITRHLCSTFHFKPIGSILIFVYTRYICAVQHRYFSQEGTLRYWLTQPWFVEVKFT